LSSIILNLIYAVVYIGTSRLCNVMYRQVFKKIDVQYIKFYNGTDERTFLDEVKKYMQVLPTYLLFKEIDWLKKLGHGIWFR